VFPHVRDTTCNVLSLEGCFLPMYIFPWFIYSRSRSVIIRSHWYVALLYILQQIWSKRCQTTALYGPTRNNRWSCVFYVVRAEQRWDNGV
jgi:hypothetical protein